MPRKPPDGSLVFLDACCLINLFATGRIETILQALPYRFATSAFVADEEVLAIRRTTADGIHEREIVTPRRLARQDLVAIMPIESESEQAELVRFAADLDDGEASVCALAVVHGGGVATDDRKALRVLSGLGFEVPVLETPELLQAWAASGVADGTVREVLSNVTTQGRFYPRADSPGFGWWSGFF